MKTTGRGKWCLQGQGNITLHCYIQTDVFPKFLSTLTNQVEVAMRSKTNLLLYFKPKFDFKPLYFVLIEGKNLRGVHLVIIPCALHASRSLTRAHKAPKQV